MYEGKVIGVAINFKFHSGVHQLFDKRYIFTNYHPILTYSFEFLNKPDALAC